MRRAANVPSGRDPRSCSDADEPGRLSTPAACHVLSHARVTRLASGILVGRQLGLERLDLAVTWVIRRPVGLSSSSCSYPIEQPIVGGL